MSETALAIAARDLIAAAEDENWICYRGTDEKRTGFAALEDALSSLPASAPPDAQTWQPIETHDKSHEAILVAMIHEGRVLRAEVAYYNKIGYYSRAGGVQCHWRTHWMPLPAPPKDRP